MDLKAVERSMATGTDRMWAIIEQVEKIPWHWVGLFTTIVLLIVSVLVKKIDSNSHILYYGGEYGAVGAALAQGRGFSDPFSMGSGPTAWVSPLLPAIIGIVFYFTSLKITVTYWILLFIKITSLGFGAGLIWAVLQKSGRGMASVCYLWMGILCYMYNLELFALYHDEWLIFLVISLAFWAWRQRTEFKGRIVLTVAFSAAALCNPILWGALFAVMLVFNREKFHVNDDMGESSLKKQRNQFARNSFRIAISVSILLIVGWTVRNGVQLKIFAPIKSNAGYELFQAQVTSRNGVPDSSTFAKHPIIFTSKEHQGYKILGETDFLRTRRDSAISRILADPSDFYRRIAQRFTNAFLFTASPLNTALVDSKIAVDDLERLHRAGFVEYRNDQTVWIDLDDPDKEIIQVLPSLGLANPQLVLDNWRSMSEGHYWYRFSWERIIRGSLIGGMPWVCLLMALWMRRRSESSPDILWAALFLFLYLMPYVLISHYMRYQVPLLGMQAILLTGGTVSLMRTIKQDRIRSTHPAS
jgi:hypothetical protein